MVSVSDVVEWIVFFVVVIISITIFEVAIQPVLAYIDPAFADNVISLPGRNSNTPAQVAMLVTMLIISFVEIAAIRPLVRLYFPNNN